MACVQYNQVSESSCDYSKLSFTLSSKGYVYANMGNTIAPLVIQLASGTPVMSSMDGYPGKISVGVRKETLLFLKDVIDKYCAVNRIADESVTKKYPNTNYSSLIVKHNNTFEGNKASTLKQVLIKPKVYDFPPEGVRMVGVTLYAVDDVLPE